MTETLQPLIHKAQLLGLRVHVGRAGLCLGDAARALPLEDVVEATKFYALLPTMLNNNL